MKKTPKKRLGVKAKSKLRDLVRLCKCGTRIVCQIKNHGYLDILKVESNGYLFRVAFATKHISYGVNYDFGRQDEYINWDLVMGQTGYNKSYLLNECNNNFKKQIDKGLFIKPRKIDNLPLDEYQKEYLVYKRPIYLSKSLYPDKVNYIRCLDCHSKLMLKVFKEIKDV